VCHGADVGRGAADYLAVAQAAPEQAQAISATALPAILLLELLGAILATLALRRAGETSLKAAAPQPAPQDGA